MPQQRLRLVFLHKTVLRLRIRTDIVRMTLGKLPLQLPIQPCDLRMRNDVVAKSQVANDVFAANCERMHLMCPDAPLIITAKVTATGDSELAFSLVAQRLHTRRSSIQLSQTRYFEENVDDRLSQDPRDGGATDVVQCQDRVSQCCFDSTAFKFEVMRPNSVIWHYADDHGTPAFAA